MEMSRPTFESPLFHWLLWVLIKCQIEKILRFFELMTLVFTELHLARAVRQRLFPVYVNSYAYMPLLHYNLSCFCIKFFHITLVNLWPVFTGIC